MNIRGHHIEVKKTARYFTLGNTSDPKQVWYVLHGYGFLPEYFIRKFRSMNLADKMIVAPEGLHRFYLSGESGRVGASWMTKEDRLTDIADYISYLDHLHDQITSVLSSKPDVVILGFSQGAATASRWVDQGRISPNGFTLWASVFPPDVDFSVDSKKFNQFKTVLVYGDNDKYHSLEKFREHTSQLEQEKIPFEVIEFSGEHNIYPEPLLELENRMKFD